MYIKLIYLMEDSSKYQEIKHSHPQNKRKRIRRHTYKFLNVPSQPQTIIFSLKLNSDSKIQSNFNYIIISTLILPTKKFT